jgi:hypothetical protein
MRRADAAELILSLVTSPERASSIAGDLLEAAEGTGQFWRPVARTAVGQMWRQVSTNPSGLGRAALWAFIRMIGFALLGSVLLVVGLMILISVLKVGFGKDVRHWGSPALTFLLYAWVNIAVGRRIARRWPGRECAVAFSLVVLMRAIALGATLLFWTINHYGGEAHADFTIDPVSLISWNGDLVHGVLTGAASSVTDFLTLVAGAAYERSKSLRATVA